MAAPVIESVHALGEERLEIVFHDDAAVAGEHVLQAETDLPAAQWKAVLALAAPLDGGRYTLQTDVNGANRFFRVLGNYAGAGEDADEDGLSDWQEERFGTRPDLADTDDDGFSDALEIGAKTNPLEDTDFPHLLAQPGIRFRVSLSTSIEQAGTLGIELESDRPYEGPVFYAIAALSNTSQSGPSPDFAPLSGRVEMNGTSATLTLSCLDDDHLEKVESLVLDLLEDTGGRYHVGTIPRHTLMLEDNDAYWNGILAQEQTQLHFRLRLIETEAGLTGMLVSKLEPGNTTGIGTIPPGEWAMTVHRTGVSFEAQSVPMATATSVLFETNLLRTISLEALPPDDTGPDGRSYYFSPRTIVGDYRDTLVPQDPKLAYLKRETGGTFILTKDLPAMEALVLPTIPADLRMEE